MHTKRSTTENGETQSEPGGTRNGAPNKAGGAEQVAQQEERRAASMQQRSWGQQWGGHYRVKAKDEKRAQKRRAKEAMAAAAQRGGCYRAAGKRPLTDARRHTRNSLQTNRNAFIQMKIPCTRKGELREGTNNTHDGTDSTHWERRRGRPGAHARGGGWGSLTGRSRL